MTKLPDWLEKKRDEACEILPQEWWLAHDRGFQTAWELFEKECRPVVENFMPEDHDQYCATTFKHPRECDCFFDEARELIKRMEWE